MSESSKSIQIEIAATGGDAAAAEIKKPVAATNELGTASTETAERVKDLDQNIANFERVQRSQAVAKLADDALKLAQGFRKAADDVEAFDKEAASSMRDTARHIEDVSQAVSQVASGFAVGGPLGAAVASLGVMVQSLTAKWHESKVVALEAAASEKAAVEEIEKATRDAITAAEERATAISSAGVLGAMDLELNKAKQITDEIRRQIDLAREKRALENEVLSARDRSNLEKVNLEEASGKITPEQAAKKRDDIEGAAHKRALDEKKRRALEDAVNAGQEAIAKTSSAKEAQTASDDLGSKRDDAEKALNDLTLYVAEEIKKIVPKNKKTGELSDDDKRYVAEMQDELERAKKLLSILEKAAKEAEAAAAKAGDDAATARAKAADKTVTAKNTTAAVNEMQSVDTERMETRSKIREANEIKKQEREAERQRQAAEREAEKKHNAEAKVGRDAVKLLPPEVSEKFRRAVTTVTDRLQDGDQGGEVKELAELLHSLATAMNNRGQHEDSRYQEIRREISNINSRAKIDRCGR